MSDMKLTTRDMEILSKAFQCFQSPDALKMDYDKLAQLAGFSNGRSANASWLVLKKKLMGGATVESATGPTTPKKPKAKAKAIANADAGDDDEATPTKAAPKKRGKAIKTEPADAEGADADNEITPGAESPKKGRAKKGTAASKADNDTNDAATTEPLTTTPKRKRGPNKPKDPNAPPAKRGKKAANAQPQADEAAPQTNGEGSIFGGDADVKKEEVEDDDDRPFDAEEQKMVEDANLFGPYDEGEVA